MSWCMKQPGLGYDLGEGRTGRGRFDRAVGVIVVGMVVVTVRRVGVVADRLGMRLVDHGGVAADRRRVPVAMPVVVVMLDGVAARVTGVRAVQGDDGRDQRADQRQEYDSLDHALAFASSRIASRVSDG